MQLSFVSRQCLKLRTKLSFNQPPVVPTTEESTGDILVWLCCHFKSCQPPRSNPSTCDSAVYLGPDAAGHSRLCCMQQHGQSARGPPEPRQGTGVCASPQSAKTKQLFSWEEAAIQVAFTDCVEHLQPWGKQWQHTLRKTCCSLHSGFLWCTQDLNDTFTNCFLYFTKDNQEHNSHSISKTKACWCFLEPVRKYSIWDQTQGTQMFPQFCFLRKKKSTSNTCLERAYWFLKYFCLILHLLVSKHL